jgi:hypothetical protein
MKLPTLPADVPGSVTERIRRDEDYLARRGRAAEAIQASFPRVALILPLLGVPLFCFFRDVNLFSMRVLKYTAASAVVTYAIALAAYLVYVYLRDKYDFSATRLREKLHAIAHVSSRRY